MFDGALAAEGIRSVELCNAMLLSSWKNKKVNLPISARSYSSQLKQRVVDSRFNKVVKSVAIGDMTESF